MQFWLAFVAVLALVFGGLRAFGDEPKAGDQSVQKSACCQSKEVASKDGAACQAKTVADKTSAECQSKCSATATAAKGDDCCLTKAAADKAACDAKSMATIPAMMYRVGDKDMCCSEMAGKLAKETNGTVKFVVAGKAYDKQAEALTAYADVLEAHFAKVTNIQYAVGDDCGACPMTAAKLAKEKGTQVKYQLATYRFNDQKTAEKAVADAKAAADKVMMTMVVGAEKYECPVSAKDAADKAGKPIEYAVGECRTPCKVTARVELAKARITAALKAIAADAGENHGA